MRPALLLTLRVSLLGFLVNCKPSEPFLALYLNETKRFTDEQLATQIFPWSYVGTFGLLLPFGIAAEFVGCRPVILVGLLCREATRVLLIFGERVGEMALMQVAYGAGAAADAIYFAYVYTVSPSAEWYAVLTSAVLAGYHAGNVVGALIAELLVSCLEPEWRSDVTPLFYLSLATCSLGLIAFAALPPPTRAPQTSLARQLARTGGRATCRTLFSLWASRESLGWLSWWALCASGNLIVLGYFQLQVLEVSSAAPFGMLEAAIEAGLVVGAFSSLPMARLATRRPAALFFLLGGLRAAALGGSVVGARADSVAAPCLFNVLAAVLFGLQDAAGRTLLASAMSEPARAPLLFSANTLVANGVAAALSGCAGAGWGANDYFVAAAALQAAVACLTAPLLARSADDGGAGAREYVATVDAPGAVTIDNVILAPRNPPQWDHCDDRRK